MQVPGQALAMRHAFAPSPVPVDGQPARGSAQSFTMLFTASDPPVPEGAGPSLPTGEPPLAGAGALPLVALPDPEEQTPPNDLGDIVPDPPLAPTSPDADTRVRDAPAPDTPRGEGPQASVTATPAGAAVAASAAFNAGHMPANGSSPRGPVRHLAAEALLPGPDARPGGTTAPRASAAPGTEGSASPSGATATPAPPHTGAVPPDPTRGPPPAPDAAQPAPPVPSSAPGGAPPLRHDSAHLQAAGIVPAGNPVRAMPAGTGTETPEPPVRLDRPAGVADADLRRHTALMQPEGLPPGSLGAVRPTMPPAAGPAAAAPAPETARGGAADAAAGEGRATAGVAGVAVDTRVVRHTGMAAAPARRGDEGLAGLPNRLLQPLASAGESENALQPAGISAPATSPQALDAPAPLPKPVAGPSAALVAQVSARIGTSLHAGLAAGDERRLEIRLDPPELGSVRMLMSMSDHGLSLHVFADRGDTLELLRRHVSLLAADLSRLGFGSAAFSFHGGDGGPPARDHARPEALKQAGPPGTGLAHTAEAPAARVSGTSTLDLRI